MYIYIYINDIRLKDPSGTSDLGFQVWTAVRLGISSLDSCQTWDIKSEQLSDFGSQGARIQDPRSNMFKKLFLDPEQKSWIQMGLLDPRFSNTSFSKSWILDPDPRFLPWIQEKFFENLGSWILTMSDLRFSNLNSFQT